MSYHPWDDLPNPNAMQFLRVLIDWNHIVLYSTERGGPVSGSELKRWFEKGSVWFDGKPVKKDDPVVFPVTSLVIHPKGHKITLW